MTASPATTPETGPGTSGWRTLLRAALGLLIGVGVFIHVLAQEPIPPVIVFMVLFVVALVLLGRSGRAGTVGTWLGGIAALLFLLLNLPFVLPDLSHPESPVTFILGVAGVVGALTGTIALVGTATKRGGGAARPVGIAAGVAVVAAIVFGFVSAAGVDDDERQAGDIELVAEEVDYLPDALEVESGGAVFVENKDIFRHTFVVEKLDISVELPAGASRRVVIDGDPGTYRFICDVEGHEQDMNGELTVA